MDNSTCMYTHIHVDLCIKHVCFNITLRLTHTYTYWENLRNSPEFFILSNTPLVIVIS